MVCTTKPARLVLSCSIIFLFQSPAALSPHLPPRESTETFFATHQLTFLRSESYFSFIFIEKIQKHKDSRTLKKQESNQKKRNQRKNRTSGKVRKKFEIFKKMTRNFQNSTRNLQKRSKNSYPGHFRSEFRLIFVKKVHSGFFQFSSKNPQKIQNLEIPQNSSKYTSLAKFVPDSRSILVKNDDIFKKTCRNSRKQSKIHKRF